MMFFHDKGVAVIWIWMIQLDPQNDLKPYWDPPSLPEYVSYARFLLKSAEFNQNILIYRILSRFESGSVKEDSSDLMCFKLYLIRHRYGSDLKGHYHVDSLSRTNN